MNPAQRAAARRAAEARAEAFRTLEEERAGLTGLALSATEAVARIIEAALELREREQRNYATAERHGQPVAEPLRTRPDLIALGIVTSALSRHEHDLDEDGRATLDALRELAGGE